MHVFFRSSYIYIYIWGPWFIKNAQNVFFNSTGFRGGPVELIGRCAIFSHLFRQPETHQNHSPKINKNDIHFTYLWPFLGEQGRIPTRPFCPPYFLWISIIANNFRYSADPAERRMCRATCSKPPCNKAKEPTIPSQEASLESNEGFRKGGKSYLTIAPSV